MKRTLLCLLTLTLFLLSTFVEARVGGGRSFGSRGTRGFSTSYTPKGSPFRSNQAPAYSPPMQTPFNNSQGYNRPSVLHSLGAGLAGGFLGSMLFRSLGGSGSLGVQPGGIGLLEMILLGGFLFFLIRMFMNRTQTSSVFSRTEGAAGLMKQARPMGWSENPQQNMTAAATHADTQSISNDLAMDLFFQVQGAWKNRNISPIENLLECDAKAYLNEEVSRLRTSQHINCLENIAVRGTDIVESWEEAGKEYSTVRFTANLLDFTIDEQTQQVVEGSKISPVKFEEYWTFSKESGSSQWKLSAIQQS